MDRFFHDNTNGLDYELVGDYYLPCLKAPEPMRVGSIQVRFQPGGMATNRIRPIALKRSRLAPLC